MRRYGKGTTQIRAKVGESFVVELPALATGGYAWQVARTPETAVLGEVRTRPAGAAVGASSIQEFEFVATRPGEGLLVMVYGRPWEKTVSERLEVTIAAER
ncbi:MAG: protease inhibitor I42 family protein [Burkholderiales bacterium]|nr:protease inhibitor I42 family protein [Burkholderiales bacterium]